MSGEDTTGCGTPSRCGTSETWGKPLLLCPVIALASVIFLEGIATRHARREKSGLQYCRGESRRETSKRTGKRTPASRTDEDFQRVSTPSPGTDGEALPSRQPPNPSQQESPP